jgi:hypothetical protein
MARCHQTETNRNASNPGVNEYPLVCIDEAAALFKALHGDLEVEDANLLQNKMSIRPWRQSGLALTWSASCLARESLREGWSGRVGGTWL